MSVARVLLQHVARTRPDVYRQILLLVRPHSLNNVESFLQQHLEPSVATLDIFNRNQQRIPEFCLEFVRAIRRRFPAPGDAFGIHLTCRITKSNTQSTLDSKHLKTSAGNDRSYNVDKSVRYELSRFTSQTQVFEMATRHACATVWTHDVSSAELLQRLPNAGKLERGFEANKATDAEGRSVYLSTLAYIVVEPDRVMYKTGKEWYALLRRLNVRQVVAFSDIRAVYQKCGIVSYFFNLLRVVERQLFRGDVERTLVKDVVTIVKYQCQTGQPLPMTRNGLEKNPNWSLLEILSFEAWKMNLARMCTQNKREETVTCSTDKMFFREQPVEGTGGNFALIPKRQERR